jgi:urea transport system ATP-binding protein
MMDIITGKTRPDSGTVFFGSTIDLLRHNEPEIAQLGIGRKFQKPTVFEQLTVFENLELALKTHKGVKPACSSGSTARRATAWPRCCTPSTWRAACTAGRPAQPRPEAVAGDRHAADAGPKLLLLDEPVAGMTDEETARTAELFLRLKGKHSLMVVEHDMASSPPSARRSRCCAMAACWPKARWPRCRPMSA